LEFPLDLDLSNYLLDKDISSKYHLVGVVVHIGAAEFGHYFSYIDVGKN
jgi:ubiquitin carboxyl-terminal hydrolase 34